MLPIHFAAMFNRLDVVAMLLDRGSDLTPPPAKKASIPTCVCTTQGRCLCGPACKEGQRFSRTAGAGSRGDECTRMPPAQVSTPASTLHSASPASSVHVHAHAGSPAGVMAHHPPDCGGQDGPHRDGGTAYGQGRRRAGSVQGTPPAECLRCQQHMCTHMELGHSSDLCCQPARRVKRARIHHTWAGAVGFVAPRHPRLVP